MQPRLQPVGLRLQQRCGGRLHVDRRDEPLFELAGDAVVGQLRRAHLLLPLHVLLAVTDHLAEGLRHLALDRALHGRLLQGGVRPAVAGAAGRRTAVEPRKDRNRHRKLDVRTALVAELGAERRRGRTVVDVDVVVRVDAARERERGQVAAAHGGEIEAVVARVGGRRKHFRMVGQRAVEHLAERGLGHRGLDPQLGVDLQRLLLRVVHRLAQADAGQFEVVLLRREQVIAPRLLRLDFGHVGGAPASQLEELARLREQCAALGELLLGIADRVGVVDDVHVGRHGLDRRLVARATLAARIVLMVDSPAKRGIEAPRLYELLKVVMSL